MSSSLGTRGRRRAAVLAVLTTAALLLSACSSDDGGDDQATTDTGAEQSTAAGLMGTTSGPPDDEEPTDGGALVMALEGEPAGLNTTAYAFSSSGHYIASAVFESLAALDENGEAVPYLAESIEPNEDYTEWTITIPEGVTFHDGTALTADVVKQNLDAILESEITSPAFWAVTAVEVTDPTTITMTFSEPFVRLPYLLTAQGGYIMAPAMLENPDLALAPIGTGPFMYDDHVPDVSWTVTRFPDYRIEGLPHLDSIEFRIVPDNAERLELLETGSVDVIFTQRPEQVIELRDSDNKIVEYSSGDESILVLNTSVPPFDNLTARQAVAYATNSAEWVEQRQQGVDSEANSPFAPGQPGYLEDNGYPEFDMARAQELVAQYEAETGQPLAFSWTTQEDVDNLQDTQFFIEAYEEAGMDVTITAIPQINLVATVATGNYEMARFRLYNQPEPDADSHFWRTSSIGEGLVSLNFPRYDNPAVDEAINRALAAEDFEGQDEAYQEVNRIFAENVPIIWLGRSNWVLAADPSVNGIYEGANGSIQTIGVKPWLGELWLSR